MDFQDYEDKLVQMRSQQVFKILSYLKSVADPENLQLLHRLENTDVEQWPEAMGIHLCKSLHELNSELQSILAAQSQFDIGQYGYCASCEKKLEPQRLCSDPTTQYCLECQTKLNKAHR
ncbi:MAG: TraR/DksA C4-type zinc finger protein [Gammaproteobacteria bacterium]|nr:TraR/DksA C4-type zinc finger protein [Gammaproteobacteria bacterium]